MNKNTITVIAVSVALAIASFNAFNNIETPQARLDVATIQKFNQWALKHSKTYTSPRERAYRMNVFTSKLKRIEEVNSDPSKGYRLGLNRFSDMTHEEFVIKYTGKKPTPLSVPLAKQIQVKQNAPSKDWVALGKVTSVKAQLDCGSCWAFSTNGAIESNLLVDHNLITNLSEQQLVDCSWDWGNNGCEGGLEVWALAYANDVQGITREFDYPYTATDTASCKFNKETAIPTKFEFGRIEVGEENLVTVLNKYPVAVGVVVSGDFELYESGIYQGTCQHQRQLINHGVVAVAYGTDSETGKEFFTIKNSWGTGWGEAGYMRIIRGELTEIGYCGLAADVLDARVTEYQ